MFVQHLLRTESTKMQKGLFAQFNYVITANVTLYEMYC
jgi:hypothetical protein